MNVWRNRWFDTVGAFLDRDLNKMEEAFERVQGQDQDPDDLTSLTATYQYFRYAAGDVSALVRLEAMAATPEAMRAAKRAIGMCYDRSGQYDLAASAYEGAAEASPTEIGRAEMIVALARSQSKSTYPTGAADRILMELDRTAEPVVRVELLKGLAQVYEQLGDKLLRALALELALSHQPNDVGAQFDAAYAYSESGVPLASLLHYDQLLAFKPDHLNALNNKGVAYSDLGLTARAVGAFEAASRDGNTLASANLAHRLIAIGMTSSAGKLLEEARAKEDIHPNVWTAMEALEKAQTSESDKLEKFLPEAARQQEFLLAHGDACFTPSNKRVALDGRWSVAGGAPFDIVSADSKLTATWSDDETVFFEGSILGNGVNLRTKDSLGSASARERRIPDNEGRALDSAQGAAFVAADGGDLRLMTWRVGEIAFVTFSR